MAVSSMTLTDQKGLSDPETGRSHYGMHIHTTFGRKDSGTRPWESLDSAWALRVEGPERRQPRQLGKNEVGTLAPGTARRERKLDVKARNPVKRETMMRWLCTVDRPSDRDHFFTGEGEGREEPLEWDGTTRQSRGAKWYAWKARCAPGELLELGAAGHEGFSRGLGGQAVAWDLAEILGLSRGLVAWLG
ncbi:hypothetical protein CRG98_016822 [Punica granatum]|uniref:Uncharacterized protein n=1 Tax=Punica granatum TaxID=22663 RepID=A0A2I0K2K7_PUNGR|nr:hypothetical protein CRG98_016822 [Punica granatum]